MSAKENGTPVGAPNYHTSNSNIATTTNQRICEGKRRARKDYVENVLCEALKVKSDFEDIRYGRNVLTEREYMRVRDIFGGHITINITNLELHEILNYACWIVLNGFVREGGIPVPDGIVADKDELRKLAPLFKS